LIDWRTGVDENLGELLRRKGLRANESIHPVYVALEAEQQAHFKPYRQVLQDTAILVAKYFRLSITEGEAREFAATIKKWKPFDDTVPSLKELGRRGYKRVILSNVDRDLLQETISYNDLQVDGYITAEDVGSYKPAIGHWNRFFEQYKVEKREVLHVAQSVYHDIIPATRIGLASVWINRYGEPKPAEVEPAFVTSGMSELLDLLG
jgi:2-haloalkanoic acid dehalogenase type II